MTSPGSALRSWLDALDEDDVRDLIDDAMAKVPALADWLDTQRVAASDDPADLLAIVNRDLTPSRRFYDYYQANRYAQRRLRQPSRSSGLERCRRLPR